MGLNDTYIFSHTPVSAKTWRGLEGSEYIMIRINLAEDDVDLLDSDDEFVAESFTYSVEDLISEIEESSTGYSEKSGLTVYSGTESITLTFRFSAD